MIQELNSLVKYQGEIMDNFEINIAKNYFLKMKKQKLLI